MCEVILNRPYFKIGQHDAIEISACIDFAYLLIQVNLNTIFNPLPPQWFERKETATPVCVSQIFFSYCLTFKIWGH